MNAHGRRSFARASKLKAAKSRGHTARAVDDPKETYPLPSKFPCFVSAVLAPPLPVAASLGTTFSAIALLIAGQAALRASSATEAASLIASAAVRSARASSSVMAAAGAQSATAATTRNAGQCIVSGSKSGNVAKSFDPLIRFQFIRYRRFLRARNLET